MRIVYLWVEEGKFQEEAARQALWVFGPEKPTTSVTESREQRTPEGQAGR